MPTKQPSQQLTAIFTPLVLSDGLGTSGEPSFGIKYVGCYSVHSTCSPNFYPLGSHNGTCVALAKLAMKHQQKSY